MRPRNDNLIDMLEQVWNHKSAFGTDYTAIPTPDVISTPENDPSLSKNPIKKKKKRFRDFAK